MDNLRERIFEIIEPDRSGNHQSRIYDIVMVCAIIGSLAPLTTHKTSQFLTCADIISCIIFIIDYLIRWWCADLPSERKGVKAFLLYPVTPMAIVDLLSILPSLALISPAFKVLRVSRLFKIIRIFKFIRYYEPLQILLSVIRKEAKTLMTVLICAISYILICALVMFNVESSPSIVTFYDAIYWACCTLTTVGYGDIYPITPIGRAFSMISAIVGIALIALPSGIITSRYMEELRARKEKKQNTNEVQK